MLNRYDDDDDDDDDDDALNYNCPFPKIFDTLINNTINHRQVSLVSHFHAATLPWETFEIEIS